MRGLLIALSLPLLSSLAMAGDGANLIISGATEIVIRIDVRQDDKPAEAVWDQYLTRWFEIFDEDRNGKLDQSECEQVPGLFNVTGQQVRITKAADGDHSGFVDRQEFVKYYVSHNVTAFQVAVPVRDEMAIRSSEDLWLLLDLDRDDSLSQSELLAATKLLNRCDLNEDECLTPGELFSQQPSEQLPDIPLRWSDDSDNSASPIRLSFNLVSRKEEPPKAIVMDGFSEIHQLDGHRFRLPFPSGVSIFDCRDSSSERIVAAKKYLQAELRSAFGNHSALSLEEIRSNPNLEWLKPFFSNADKNQDQSLDESEIEMVVDALAEGAAAQICLSVSFRGRNIFDLIDKNTDGRLDWRELSCAQESVKNRFQDSPTKNAQFVSRADIPLSLTVSLSRGPVAGKFGRLRIARRKLDTDRQRHSLSAPRWFNAMDRNGDQALSHLEFLGTKEQFERLDQNQDSLICLDEIASE